MQKQGYCRYVLSQKNNWLPALEVSSPKTSLTVKMTKQIKQILATIQNRLLT